MKALDIQQFVDLSKSTLQMKSAVKDLFDMNVKKLKVLMYMMNYQKNDIVKVRPLRRMEGWNDSQTTQILTQLQKQGWLSKRRYKEDERQIIISADDEQYERIEALLIKVNRYIKTHMTFTYMKEVRKEPLEKFIKQINILTKIEHYAKQCDYSLDEMIILAMLLLEKHEHLTVKQVKVDLESNTVKINKIVKKLVAKSLITKSRDLEDERVVVLTLVPEQKAVVEKHINAMLSYIS